MVEESWIFVHIIFKKVLLRLIQPKLMLLLNCLTSLM